MRGPVRVHRAVCLLLAAGIAASTASAQPVISTPVNRRLPVWMRGRILGHPVGDPKLRLAVSLNGKIVAVTETFIDNTRQIAFRALLPEAKFREGVNPFEVFVIQTKPTGIQLARIRNSEWGWKLRGKEGELSLVSSAGHRVPIRSGSLRAGIDRKERGRRRMDLIGWAVDVGGGEEEVHAAFFKNGVSDLVVATWIARPDIAQRHLGQAEDDRMSGFRISVPHNHLKGKDQRLFAFTSKSAVEIPISQ